MKKRIFFILVILLFFPFLLSANLEKKETKSPIGRLNSATVEGLKFRCIGPALASGRVSDFAVNPKNRSEYYVAFSSSSVWKTVNSGTTWIPVFDKEGSYSIGCIAMDPKNSNILWVGTGENNSQRSVSYGDGIYRSEDGGKYWENMGLRFSEHISKIIIDPRDSDVVYSACQGPLWGPGGDRGLYKTTDGGVTWKAVLTISENTGVNDLVMDPRDPDVLYASSYQRRRHVFTLINGGPESAIFKTIDGGKTWKKLAVGLPEADMGRIGLAISPADYDVVYAIIEAADGQGGFFRSTNCGATWEKRSDYVSGSGQYYNEIYCDPKDINRVYAMDTFLMVTDNGGRTFYKLDEKGKHVDNHAIWIDPHDTDYYLFGCDCGVYESFDRGATWEFKNNLPTLQFYRVSVDNALPFYNVYGGTQDNGNFSGPSRTNSIVGIVNSDWTMTYPGDGYESLVDPENPNIVYVLKQYGGLVRYDKKSGEITGIKPQEGKGEEPYRWNWDSPIIISPHLPTRLYLAANKIFRSDDKGNTWEAISGDLTRRIDRDKLPVMGRIWSVDAVARHSATSFYGNIVSLSESPRKRGLLYVGTDDGLINVTEDGGASWRRIGKFSGIPEMTYVSCICASQHDVDTVYAAFDNHKNSDFNPYLLKSSNKGKTWTSIKGNLPERGSVCSIAEDHVNPDLIFVGTEFGVFFTIDGGKNWVQLKSGIPTISVRDIAIQRRENDLVLGTFGRGFYILDDYSPLQELNAKILDREAHLLPIKDAYLYIESRPLGFKGNTFLGSSYFTARNPYFGATFTYYLKESIKTKKQKRQEAEEEARKKGIPVSIPSLEELREEDDEEDPFLLFTVFDESGNAVRKLKAPAVSGINRITWDLRYPSINPPDLKIPEEDLAFFDHGSKGWPVLPGTYKVIVEKSVNGIITKVAGPGIFKVVPLEITSLPPKDRKVLVEFQNKIGELSRSVIGAIEVTKELEKKIKNIKEALLNTPKTPAGLMDSVRSLEISTNDIIRKLIMDRTMRKSRMNMYPSVSRRLEHIVYEMWQSTSEPTQTQKDSYKIAAEEFEQLLADLKILIEIDLKALEKSLEELGAPWTSGRLPKWKKK